MFLKGLGQFCSVIFVLPSLWLLDPIQTSKKFYFHIAELFNPLMKSANENQGLYDLPQNYIIFFYISSQYLPL